VSEFKLGMANVTFVMRQSKYSWLGMTSAIIEPGDGGKIEVNTAEAFDKGVDAEQERIINLLEDDSVGYCTCKWGVNELVSGELVEVQEFTCEPHRYIALIKGEK
jgi:hypothetical protein